MPVIVRTVGWDKTAKNIRKLERILDKEIRARHLREFAVRARNHLVESVEKQSIPLAPLSARYLQWKIVRGYDRRVLIRTGDYLESIVVGKVVRGKVSVGVSKSAKASSRVLYTTKKGNRRRKATPMWLVAKWLEFGTKGSRGRPGMPKRPHWGPLGKWVSVEFPKYMKGMVDQSVRRTR